jgi:hypothetical protein
MLGIGDGIEEVRRSSGVFEVQCVLPLISMGLGASGAWIFKIYMLK